MELTILLIIALLGAIVVLGLMYPTLVKKLHSGRAALYMSLGVYLAPLFIAWGYLFEPGVMGVGYLIATLLSLSVIITGNLARHFATPLPEASALNTYDKQSFSSKTIVSLTPNSGKADKPVSKKEVNLVKPTKSTVKNNDF